VSFFLDRLAPNKGVTVSDRLDFGAINVLHINRQHPQLHEYLHHLNKQTHNHVLQTLTAETVNGDV